MIRTFVEEKLKVTSTAVKAGKFMKKALLAFVVRRPSLIPRRLML